LSEQYAARRYLLDTHTALWALERPAALTASARSAVATGPNVLSVVVYWEVVIKSMKGKLDVGDPRAWWLDALHQLAATALPLHPEHVAAIRNLPPLHKDPFDRALIAQAMVEGLTLVTADADVARYASAGLRVVV
jgi:PIN domain nuclease of toxin-antitoxin system